MKSQRSNVKKAVRLSRLFRTPHSELRTAFTPLNLHPLIVHFPIALILIGVFCDAIGILTRRDFFLNAGYLLFSTGAVFGIAAAGTGQSTAEIAQYIDGIADDLSRHETFGTAAAWLSVALVMFRTHFTLKKRFSGIIRHIYLALALSVAGLIGAAGYTGGQLVYRHGAGTEPVIRSLDIPETPRHPATTFESSP